jgi:hypothetical protein
MSLRCELTHRILVLSPRLAHAAAPHWPVATPKCPITLAAKGKGAGGDGEKALRVDRLLSNRGLGSRAEVTRLIKRGSVRLETGEVIRHGPMLPFIPISPQLYPYPLPPLFLFRDPGMHLSPASVLYVGDEAWRPLPVLLAYHKPVGVHSTMGDPWGRPNLEEVRYPSASRGSVYIEIMYHQQQQQQQQQQHHHHHHHRHPPPRPPRRMPPFLRRCRRVCPSRFTRWGAWTRTLRGCCSSRPTASSRTGSSTPPPACPGSTRSPSRVSVLSVMCARFA